MLLFDPLRTPAALCVGDRGLMSRDGLNFLVPRQSARPGGGVLSIQARALAALRAGAQAPVDRRGAWPAKPLTAREIDVLQLLRGSLMVREIAVELRLSPNTVKTHTQAIYRKLGVSTRRDAVARGQGAGVVPPVAGPPRATLRVTGSCLPALPGLTGEPAGSMTT